MYHSVIMFFLYFIVGCTQKKSSVVPSLMEKTPESHEVFWLPYRALSMEEYSAKPQIIYVTADWCLSCVRFERDVLLHRSIQGSLLERGFVAFRADWTQNDPEVSALMEQYEVQILPFLVIIKDGTTIILKEGTHVEQLEKAIAD